MVSSLLTELTPSLRSREHGELVTALKLAGRLDFNPLTDELVSPGGEKFKLDPPTGHRLPSKGFDPGQDTYQESPEQGTEAEIHVDPTSGDEQGEESADWRVRPCPGYSTLLPVTEPAMGDGRGEQLRRRELMGTRGTGA